MVACEVKGWESRSRRETESEEGVRACARFQYAAIDPKPSDLVTRRLKAG